MDDKDRSILSVLEKNSRETIRGIAKKTGLRPSTVHQRMARLEGNLIQKYTVKLDRKLAGRGFVAFVLVQAGGMLPKNIVSNPHVAEIYGITGEYDLIMKLEFEGIESFNSFLLKLRESSVVRRTLSMVATVEIKA